MLDPNEPNTPEQDEQVKHVTLLLRHLFHDKFWEDEEIGEDKKGWVLPAYFYGWLDAHMNLMNGDEECAVAQVPGPIWTFLGEVVQGGLAPERLAQLWYNVILSTRPEPRYPLKSLVLNLLLTWADGRISPIQIFADREILEEGIIFNDAVVAGLLTTRTGTMREAILTHGLDGLHDQSQNYRGTTEEDPFNVMMGLLLQHCIPMLRPELKEPVKDYARLAQGIIRPVIPPGAREKLAQQPRVEPGTAQGGWET